MKEHHSSASLRPQETPPSPEQEEKENQVDERGADRVVTLAYLGTWRRIHLYFLFVSLVIIYRHGIITIGCTDGSVRLAGNKPVEPEADVVL